MKAKFLPLQLSRTQICFTGSEVISISVGNHGESKDLFLTLIHQSEKDSFYVQCIDTRDKQNYISAFDLCSIDGVIFGEIQAPDIVKFIQSIDLPSVMIDEFLRLRVLDWHISGGKVQLLDPYIYGIALSSNGKARFLPIDFNIATIELIESKDGYTIHVDTEEIFKETFVYGGLSKSQVVSAAIVHARRFLSRPNNGVKVLFRSNDKNVLEKLLTDRDDSLEFFSNALKLDPDEQANIAHELKEKR